VNAAKRLQGRLFDMGSVCACIAVQMEIAEKGVES